MSDRVSYTAEPDPFVALPDWVLSHPELTVHDRLVYAALKHFWNRRTGQCDPSFQTIADLIHVAKRTIQSSITNLEAHGLVVSSANMKGGRQSNQYHLTAWQELPRGAERVATQTERVAGGATPGMATDATNLEDEELEKRSASASEAEPRNEIEAMRHKLEQGWHSYKPGPGGCTTCGSTFTEHDNASEI